MSLIQNRRFFTGFRTFSRAARVLAFLWIPIFATEITNKEPMKYKGIIFDFNGVLLWDSHLHEKAWKEISQLLRGSCFSSEEILIHVHGKTNRYILEYLLGRSITPQELSELSAKKESLYQNLCLENALEFRLSPGAIELLEFILENNIPHTIATASDGNNLRFFIEHLNLSKWFDVSKIVYDDGSFSGKREMYSKAAGNLRLLPQECVVIEDAHSGIKAAHQANIGKIIALGPQEKHDTLICLEGVSEAIISLEQFPIRIFRTGK